MGTKDRSAVVLDEQPLWLHAMDQLLRRAGIDVVGRTSDPNGAVALVEEHLPDVLIAGIDTANAEHVACVRRAQEIHPELRTVVVANGDSPAAIDAVFEAGASIYCTKTAEQEDIASAIRQAFKQSVYIAQERTELRRQVTAEPSPAPSELTRRELEILRLVAQGLSNAAIAKRLRLSDHTVKRHVANLLTRLGLPSRAAAAAYAAREGLLER